jgi:hypothetical protein
VLGSSSNDVVADFDAGSSDGAPGEGAAPPPSPYTVVAKNLHASAALAIDANAVYWVDEAGGEVDRTPKRGGLTMSLYGGSGTPYRAGSSIVVDAGDVYFIADVDQGTAHLSTLARLDKNGGKPTVIATSNGAPLRCVVVDDQNVYWVAGGAVMKAAKTGGTPTPIATGQTGANCVAVDGASAYVTLGGTEAKQFADGSVVVVPKRGGAAKVLVPVSEKAANVVVDDKNVYWQSASSLMKVAKSGGPAAVLAGGGAPIDDVALDDAYVYFAAHKGGDDGTVSRVPKEGGPTEALATGQHQPAGIAVDSSAVYWSCLGTEEKKLSDGTVSKRDKP